jgi:hypothetical protein
MYRTGFIAQIVFLITAWHEPFLTVPLLLHAYSLPREHVYRVVAYKRLYMSQYDSKGRYSYMPLFASPSLVTVINFRKYIFILYLPLAG